MKKNREKAWSYLTDQEKQSIYLTTGQGLSGWQAGEILQVTHYKYLELKARSETLFKLFSDYFEAHHDLVNPSAQISPAFRDYLYGSIEKRLPTHEAAIYAGDSRWSTVKVRESEILQGMKALKQSSNIWDTNLYQLIIEFDRWNNFRILPTVLQAKSPYKRKSNRQAKAYFKYLKNVNPNTITRIIKTLSYKGKNPLFIALFSQELEGGFTVIPIKGDKKNVEYLNFRRIYIFSTKLEAISFATLVIRYDMIYTSKDGLKFWKDYQETVEKAVNYSQISHVSKLKDFYDEQFHDAYDKRRPKK